MRNSSFTTRVFLAGLLMLAAPAFAHDEWCASALAPEQPAQAPVAEPSLYLAGKDVTILQRFAREQNLVLSVIAPNPEAQKYSFRPGFVAKTSDLKGCKSTREGQNAGLVQCAPHLFETQSEWLQHKAELRAMGYTVMGEEQDYLVVRYDGKKMFSDYDLLAVHNVLSGRAAYSEFFRNQINTRLGRRMVRHGPLMDYEHRRVVGLKFPIVTFTPLGVVVSHNEQEIAALYKSYGIGWDW